MIEQDHNISSAIETRILELIESHALAANGAVAGLDATLGHDGAHGAHGRTDGDGATPRGALMDAVIDQARASSRGGKRLRARLMLAFADACAAGPASGVTKPADATVAAAAGPDATALDIACAIEVFQTAALVHDDIIDDSDTRRGKPAAHRSLARAFHDADRSPRVPTSHTSDADERDNAVGSGLGIMLGDLLATVSVSIANGAEHDPRRARAVMAAFLNMQREVEIGQVLDLAAEAIDLDDPARLASNALDVFRWKTASYTTIAPIELGLLHAGVAPATARACAERIGTPLGLAFQLADDMLDVAGDTARTGKPTGGDIREGKRTALLADALMQTQGDDHTYILDAYRRPSRDDGDVARITGIFERCGALDSSRGRIRALWDESLEALDRSCDLLHVGDDQRPRLRAACEAFVPASTRV